MERILKGLSPERVFYYFEELSIIPRGSNNEKAVSDYLYETFKSKGFETIQDESLNIIIKKPATKGYENAPTIMLQGHMDMVCEKNDGIEHDFEKDSLKLRIIGDNIYASGTTLGADNGIGVAVALGLLEDETLEHPALEVVITSNEEMGMVGVKNLDFSNLKSTIMINTDNGGEGVFTASCAGGGSIDFTLHINKCKQTKKESYNLSVRGLFGGHSGADIHRGRGNAIKLLGRILYDIRDIAEISDIYGGTKTNAIPREAFAVISCDAKDELKEKISKWNEILKKEFFATDAGVVVVLEEEKLGAEILDYRSKEKLLQVINFIPSGVNTKDYEEDFVISSSNFGVLETKEDSIIFKTSLRSSEENDMFENLVPKMQNFAEMLGLKFEKSEFYPGWPFEKNSYIREMLMKTYERLNGIKGRVSSIHAGLECGFFIEKMGNLDAVAIGPVMAGAHTPEENLNIPSVGRFYNLIAETLKSIK